MKIIKNTVLLLFSLILQMSTNAQTSIVNPSTWDLVFEDEFTSDQTISGATKKWDTRWPWGSKNHDGLDYFTYYEKSTSPFCYEGGYNHEVSNGILSLITKKEPNTYEVWKWDAAGNFYKECNPFDYTTAMIYSQQQFLYGYFEIRCIIPGEGKGVFPAFWLWQGSNDAGNYREIDIFEFTLDKNLLLTNIHHQESLDCGKHDATSIGCNSLSDFKIENGIVSHGCNFQLPFCVSSGFHKYAVEWDPRYVAWYVDDKLVRKTNGHSPSLPMNIIVNNALAPWHMNFVNESNFPNRFEVDYVRVWQRKSPTTICSGNFDSANFLIMNKPSNGFIYNNCFYVTPLKGTKCPPGTSYDGANCYLMDKPSNGFIYKNRFYTLYNGTSCPINSTYDGANCLVYDTPWGHNAFEYKNKWYVTPFPECPSNSTYDGANCLICCPPCGTKAFEYSGKWYYSKSTNN